MKKYSIVAAGFLIAIGITLITAAIAQAQDANEFHGGPACAFEMRRGGWKIGGNVARKGAFVVE